MVLFFNTLRTIGVTTVNDALLLTLETIIACHIQPAGLPAHWETHFLSGSTRGS